MPSKHKPDFFPTLGTANKDELLRRERLSRTGKNRKKKGTHTYMVVPKHKRIGPGEELILPKPGQTITYLEWRIPKVKGEKVIKKEHKLKAIVKAKPIRQDGAWEILLDCPDGKEHWAWWDKTRRAWISGDI